MKQHELANGVVVDKDQLKLFSEMFELVNDSFSFQYLLYADCYFQANKKRIPLVLAQLVHLALCAKRDELLNEALDQHDRKKIGS